MNSHLETLLKEEMGYTPNRDKCKTCVHYSELIDGHKGTSFNEECSYHTIGKISVDPEGSCPEHKKSLL